MTHAVDESNFAIHNHKEIVFVLENLVKHREAINIHTSDGLDLLTTVLEVSADKGCVLLGAGRDAVVNKRVAKDRQVTFSTLSGVRVLWHSTQVDLVSLPDGEAFSMVIPKVIERIQRRDYFRLSLAHGSKGLICKIPDAGGIFEIPIEEMSAGGCGILITGTPPEIFTQGAVLDGCRVEFPSVGVIPLTLKVCGSRIFSTTKSGEHIYHVGLEFVKLSRGASNAVQRYMIQLESERLSSS